jgi:hypothetical protein
MTMNAARPGAFLGFEIVGNQRVGRGNAAGFADPDAEPVEE